MKPSLEPWEVGLADQVKRHEFDYQPEAYAQFEQLLAAEAVGAAAGSTSAAAWWASTAAKFTLLGFVLLAGVALFLYFSAPLTSPAESASADLATETQPESLGANTSSTQLPMSELTTAVEVFSPVTQHNVESPRQFTPNPAPARRRPTIKASSILDPPSIVELPVVSVINYPIIACGNRVGVTQPLPKSTPVYLTPQFEFTRQPTSIDVKEVRTFKRDRSTLFPDVKPRR